MEPILCGLETEYGLYVEGKGAEDQIEIAKALVRSFPNQCLLGWDYDFELPRADLRGFQVENLQFDPEDAKFDSGRHREPDQDLRSDRVLLNGARFYNDHGHPEYATPECASSFMAAVHDRAGEFAVLQSADALARSSGMSPLLYKNNTDFHGATYGCHENYLVPRSVGWQNLVDALIPLLVVRPILVGAGKVGSESGASCRYQLSQRADYFETLMSVDTLFRRPLCNMRDEPHADPADWIRLHVICGDANMMAVATARKLALTKLAIQLAIAGQAPRWKIKNPMKSAQLISRDETREFRIELESGSWTTAFEIFESYFAAAEACSWLSGMEFVSDNPSNDPYLTPFSELQVIPESRHLLTLVRNFDPELRNWVDWAAKLFMLESFAEQSGNSWNEPEFRSYDLEYSNLDPNLGLYAAMVESGQITDTLMPPNAALSLLYQPSSQCRSEIRSYVLRNFLDVVEKVSWGSISFRVDGRLEHTTLPANWYGIMTGHSFSNVESCIAWIRGLNDQ